MALLTHWSLPNILISFTTPPTHTIACSFVNERIYFRFFFSSSLAARLHTALWRQIPDLEARLALSVSFPTICLSFHFVDVGESQGCTNWLCWCAVVALRRGIKKIITYSHMATQSRHVWMDFFDYYITLLLPKWLRWLSVGGRNERNVNNSSNFQVSCRLNDLFLVTLLSHGSKTAVTCIHWRHFRYLTSLLLLHVSLTFCIDARTHRIIPKKLTSFEKFLMRFSSLLLDDVYSTFFYLKLIMT